MDYELPPDLKSSQRRYKVGRALNLSNLDDCGRQVRAQSALAEVQRRVLAKEYKARSLPLERIKRAGVSPGKLSWLAIDFFRADETLANSQTLIPDHSDNSNVETTIRNEDQQAVEEARTLFQPLRQPNQPEAQTN